MKRAWLIRWHFCAPSEEEQLKKIGIDNKIIDVVNTRKTFDQVIDMVKDIYRQTLLSLSEKIFLEHYSEGKKRKKYFFQRISMFTNCNTPLYRHYMKSFRENGMNHPVTENLYSKWRKYPVHAIIGNNPALEAILVYNVFCYKNVGGVEILEWAELLADGTFKKEAYEI